MKLAVGQLWIVPEAPHLTRRIVSTRNLDAYYVPGWDWVSWQRVGGLTKKPVRDCSAAAFRKWIDKHGAEIKAQDAKALVMEGGDG